VKYEENPVFLDTIYHVSNKKIGYLVYNFFAQDNGSGDIIYEKELNNIFGEFKSAQIDELVLDLRYNPGGAVVTSIALSSMISNCTKTDIFGIAQYNSLLDEYFQVEEGANYNKDYFVENLERYNNGRLVEEVPINQLGLNRLYIITSQRTASASELVINGLKPYMNVYLIGETTVGKNMGSITIYETDAEKQKTNRWGMQPIVVKFANKNGFSDYGKGFAPDNELSESYATPLVALGDVNEPLLNETLNVISGTRTKSVKSRSIGLQPIASSADRMPARKNMYIDRKTFKQKR
jgi:C-terminal processing protease CtpA/Prc